MSFNGVKGLTFDSNSKKVREKKFEEIKKNKYVTKITESNLGFYIQVDNPVIKFENVHSQSGWMPTISGNEEIQEMHFDENIIFISATAFFHTLVEQVWKILELKKNNEKFKVILMTKTHPVSSDLQNYHVIPDYLYAFFKDNNIDYYIYNCTVENVRQKISAKSVYMFYILNTNFDFVNNETCVLKKINNSWHIENCCYEIPWQFNNKFYNSYRFKSIREYLENNNISKNPISGKKIFLVRNYDAYSRRFNEFVYLNAFLRKNNFEIVYLEHYPFNVQVEICTSAEYIIAMVGSNLIVPMFCSDQTKILSIHTSTAEEYGIYHWQSARNDITIKSIYCEPDANDIIDYLKQSKNSIVREIMD